MSVSILGGYAKGFKIQLPNQISFRPTSVMLRRKFFDQRQNWEGKIFIDLCAGSGVVGLEALSRGANKVVLVEKNKQQLQILKKNIESWETHYPESKDKITMMQKDCLDFSSSYSSPIETWLFFDPPYDDHQLYEDFLDIVLEKNTSMLAWCCIEFEKFKNAPAWWIKWLKYKKEFQVIEASGKNFLIFKVKG